MPRTYRRIGSDRFASAVIDPRNGRAPRGGMTPTNVGGRAVWQRVPVEGWQTKAWTYEEHVGELAQAANWVAAGATRCILYAAEVMEDGTPGAPTDNADVIAATSGLLAQDVQPDWIEVAAYNAFIAGDMYLFGGKLPDAGTGRERDGYQVLSVDNVQSAGRNAIQLRFDDDTIRPYNPARELLIRIWRQHPRRPWRATSPVRSVLDPLCTLVKLTRVTDSISDSRLRGAGLLVLSNRLDVPDAEPGKKKPKIADVLVDVASQAINEPDSAAAHVPILLSGDLTNQEKVAELINMGVDFPKLLDQLIQRNLQRFANGMPIPKGIVLGEASNHWNEWARFEDAVKMAIAPIVRLLAAGLARSWLPAALSAAGIDPGRWTIGYDMSEIEQRPDRSGRAVEVYDRGALSKEALRRETGFDESDAPAADEEPTQDDAPPDEAPTAREPESETNAPPERPREPTDDLAAAARCVAAAALGRAGNKIRTANHQARKIYAPMKAHTIHTLATEQERMQVDPDACLDGVLDTFVAEAAAAGFDGECCGWRLKAAVAAAVRDGAPVDPSRLNMEPCRA